MKKRIADILEKMSVGFMVGAYFQNDVWRITGAVVMGVAVFCLCLDLTRRWKL